ncbi:hypothetical protein DW194_19530 [Subdoligranulum sp. AM16-9]|nr:hypothetical protein DW194_19530 [Subdoligranulum sp. AM16-9]
MNRAWRSRAIQKIGFFAILAVLGIMVVRWILFVRAQAMPTTLDMTYSNQQNNKRAGLAFTIGDAVYYPSRNGMGYMVQGREGKVSFSQCPAQESETYVVYTKDDSDPYKLYVYSKAEEAVVLKIKDVERWRLAGNTLFYSRACTDHLIVGYYPEDVYAVSLDTRQEKLLAENVMNYLVLREDKLIYALYRDMEYEKDGKLPVYQEEPALLPYYEMTLPEGGVRRLGLFEYTRRYDYRLYDSFAEGDCFYYTDRIDGRRVVVRYDTAAHRKEIAYDGDFTGLKNVFENALYLSRDKTDGDKMGKEVFRYNMETQQEERILTLEDIEKMRYFSVAVLREGEYIFSIHTREAGDLSVWYKEGEKEAYLLYK